VTAGAAAVALGAGGGLFAAGGAALAGGTLGTVSMGFGTALAASVIGGAVGSAVSQLAGMALGVVDKFSWRQVASGGLTAGALAGLGGFLGAAQPGSWAETAANALRQKDVVGYSLKGVFSYGTSQAANRVAGLSTSFSWRDLAATAVGSAAAGSIGESSAFSGLGDFTRATITGQLSAFASAKIKDQWFGGGPINYGQVAADAFGNALGNYAVGQMEPKAAVPANPYAKANDLWRYSLADAGNDDATMSTELSLRDRTMSSAAVAQSVEDAYAGGGVSVEVIPQGEYAWDPVDELGPEYQFENMLAEQRAFGGSAAIAADGRSYEQPWVGGVSGSYFEPIIGTALSAEQAVFQPLFAGQGYDYYFSQSGMAAVEPQSIDKINKEIHEFADTYGNAANYSALALGAFAKIPGSRILASAGKLQSINLWKVGAAEDLSSAISVFRSPSGKTINALLDSSGKYGKLIGGTGYIGTTLSLVDDARYIRSMPENKKLAAYAATAANTLGNSMATTLGFMLGASLGSAPTPAVFMTVPAGAALGAGAFSTGYDSAIAPMVRDAFGVPDKYRK